MKNQENVVLKQEEIDEITDLIKSGKTIQEIGETLYTKYVAPIKKQRRPRKQKALPLEPMMSTGVLLETQNVIVVQAEVEYHLESHKKITLRASEQIFNDTNSEIAKAHQDLYIKLLYSLNNIISITP